MNAVSRREGIADHVRVLLQHSDRVGVNDWLALANLALAHEEDWVSALQPLEVNEQLALLELLHREDAGPFADVLVLLMARHANEFSDPDVRAWLLDDAVEVSERRIALIEGQRAAMAELVAHAEQRQSQEFDTAVEIERLEGRLNQLRRDEVDADLHRVQQLEHEIARLERSQRSLESYDEPGRRARLEELTRTTGALEQRRDQLEHDVAAIIAERDRAQATVHADAARLDSLQAETEDLQRQTADLQRQNAEMAARQAELGPGIHELRNQHAALVQAITAAEQERADIQNQIEQDRVRLHDLRDSPAAQQATQLREKLNEIWPLLPPDEAERAFPGRTAKH